LTEGRYLLSGASDGSAAVFDVWNATEYEAGFIAKHRNILLVDKQHQNGHRFAVSAAVWYPVDTGLFVTASFDQYVKVWDTNSTQVCACILSYPSFSVSFPCFVILDVLIFVCAVCFLRSSWNLRCLEKCTLQPCLQSQQRTCSSLLGPQMFRSVCVTLLLEPLPTRCQVIVVSFFVLMQ